MLYLGVQCVHRNKPVPQTLGPDGPNGKAPNGTRSHRPLERLRRVRVSEVRRRRLDGLWPTPWPTTPPSSSGWPAPAWTGASSEARSVRGRRRWLRSRRCPSSTSRSASDTKAPSAWSRQLQKAVQPWQVLEFFPSGPRRPRRRRRHAAPTKKRFWATAIGSGTSLAPGSEDGWPGAPDEACR